jgi:predicted metal-dependent enzyme (double-stranded beta helix superfamily)
MGEMEEPPRGARYYEPKESPYQAWQKGERLPVYKGAYVPDLYSLEVAPWARIGMKGAFVNLADQEMDDAWVMEIAPGNQTLIMHHLFESVVYALEGRGATSFWQEGKPKQTLEWERGSIFSPPLNCYYQHYNLDGQKPARLVAVTNAPMVMNLYRDAAFFFNDRYVFEERFNAEDNYFTRPGEKVGRNSWQTNFIPDIRSFGLDSNTNRGAGGFLTTFTLSNNQMQGHCSEFPPGTYKKAHRHGVGAHVFILSGEGYSLLWFEGDDEPQKVDWKDGSVLSPRELEYHQHFNTGPMPARYLALRLGSLDARHYLGWGREAAGPDQIEYEDEDPAIFDQFAKECATRGAEVVLPRPNYRRAVVR